MAKSRLHTVFHVMDERGVFQTNPANRDAIDATGNSAYKGPVQYPKMMYHPEGQERVTNPGEWTESVRGPVLLGEQKEIINQMVSSLAEEKELAAAGWHDHPAKAMAKQPGRDPKSIPLAGSTDRIAELEAQRASQDVELEQLRALVKLQAPAEAATKQVAGQKLAV